VRHCEPQGRAATARQMHTQPASASNYFLLPVIQPHYNMTASSQGLAHVRVQLPGGGGHIAIKDNNGNATTRQLHTQPHLPQTVRC
jgi:hypothetical protein